MIGFDHIGTMGRLGNQMFQYAALKGIAAHRGYEYTIPPENPRIQIDNYGLIEAFELSDNKKIGWLNTQYDIIAEKHFHFDEDLFNTFPDGSGLYGFFQSEKYFKHIEDEIRKDFTFKKDWLEPCKECFGDDEYIGLHIRRTDYVQKQSYHPLCTLYYYERALKKLPNIQVIIVSDDPEWCENQELFKPDRFLISDSGSNIVDMCILSLCKYHVIANSSFSWWGAWLAESEKVIAPKIWFGSQANLDDSDLVPQHWERI